MLTIVLTRHGSTPRSDPEQHLGQRIDIALSEAGRSAASALGRRLAGIPFDRVIASPLRRTTETASLVVPGRAFETDPRIMEMDYGRWEGLTYEEIDARDAEMRRRWEAEPDCRAYPGGESGNDVARRVRSFLGDLLSMDDRADHAEGSAVTARLLAASRDGHAAPAAGAAVPATGVAVPAADETTPVVDRAAPANPGHAPLDCRPALAEVGPGRDGAASSRPDGAAGPAVDDGSPEPTAGLAVDRPNPALDRPGSGVRAGLTTIGPDLGGERRVLVVGHSSLNRVLLCVALGVPLRDYRRRFVQSPANLTVLRFERALEDGATLLVANDVAHLRGIGGITWG